MPQMERNKNLEDSNSNTIDIDALKHQRTGQKLLLGTCVISAVLVNTALPLVTDLPGFAYVATFMFLILIGVLFGCNYDRNTSYERYIYLEAFKPKVSLPYRSADDIGSLEKRYRDLAEKDYVKDEKQEKKEHKHLILRAVILIIIVISLLAVRYIHEIKQANETIHHEGSEVR